MPSPSGGTPSRRFLLGLERPLVNLHDRLQDLFHQPVCVLAIRPGLDDAHLVAHLAGIGLIVRLVALGHADDLAIQRVLPGLPHKHHHRLVHLIAHDLADQTSSLCLHRCSPLAAASSSSRRTVRSRAISCRTSARRAVFFSWPVAYWKRRLNCAWWASSRRRAISFGFKLRISFPRIRLPPPVHAARTACGSATYGKPTASPRALRFRSDRRPRTTSGQVARLPPRIPLHPFRHPYGFRPAAW